MDFWVFNTPDELWRWLAIIALNILFWVFMWGKKLGRRNQRLDDLEHHVNNPGMLTECRELFVELKEGLGEVRGNLKVILTILKINSKEDERHKHEE